MMTTAIKVTGFGIANYRSFCGEGSFVRDFGKVNVLIGKNNAGKSNVLRFLQLVAQSAQNGPGKPAATQFDQSRRTTDDILLGFAVDMQIQGEPQYVYVDPSKRAPTIADIWTKLANGEVIGDNPLEAFTDQWLRKFHGDLTTSYYQGVPRRGQLLADTLGALMKRARGEFQNRLRNLIYVPAIREIRTADSEDASGMIDLSGRNLVKTLRRMQHPAVGKEADQELFHRIAKELADLLGVKNITMEIPPDNDDIVLTTNGIRLSLAYYGTGVHELVILCTTLMLHENRVVCIEEPEIHLHPELLRKFLLFLAKTSNTYFIATHSNALLDAHETTAIYHVENDGQSSKITKSCTNDHTRAILRDLCYHASDLLQTNGIVWVEGPSDRIYINKWLELSGSRFVEGVHYSIMFYGGACLANVSAADEGCSEEFVELLRINSNVIVVIDRDGDSAATALRPYKERVRSEVGDDKCWITQGREIENYLPQSLLQRFLAQRFPDWSATVAFGENDKIDDCINLALPAESFRYGRDKKRHAKAICEHMTSGDMDCLDLKEWMRQILDAIEAWNKG